MRLTLRSLNRSQFHHGCYRKEVCARQAWKPHSLFPWGYTHSPWLPTLPTPDLEWEFFHWRSLSLQGRYPKSWIPEGTGHAVASLGRSSKPHRGSLVFLFSCFCSQEGLAWTRAIRRTWYWQELESGGDPGERGGAQRMQHRWDLYCCA